eukprot:CAMPEP_0118926836 /NCGR_PEP_ID=MMETSP1169-20130426/4449_1 /TAXON_ID=36882 /ORGANISM="Pyramimonas obovata, Strain CCMP722" /LENGTH=100 /DNA_ID=CAMNT_0006868471 /DNA_START=233 /DNA_END=535 /DNA_ORIENTATION=-
MKLKAAAEPNEVEKANATKEELFMVENYYPWIKTVEDAKKCINFLREKEKREFNLEKAEKVLQSIKDDHMASYPQLPFQLPKQYIGFLLVLKRSSDGDVC